MIKKVIFTILWMVIFRVVFFCLSLLWVGMAANYDQAHSHITRPPGSRPPDSIMLLFMIWIGLYRLAPVIALVLSIFGLLPGTKIKADKKEPL
jgi:hypothetical protein